MNVPVERRPSPAPVSTVATAELPEPRSTRRAKRRFGVPRTISTGGIGFGILLVVALVALAAPWVAGYSPLQQNLALRLRPPGTVGGEHLFLLGSDSLGRDIWARIIYGARVSLTVALVAVSVALLVGTTVGIVAGYYRGAIGAVLMRLVDIVLSIPFLLLAVATVAVLGPSFTNLVLALGLTRWPRYARVAFARTLSTREMEFVQAATVVGAGDGRLIVRHILPNVVPALIVVATLEMGLMIIYEASLSFLGLGVQPPAPSWGSMLSDGRNYLADAWWLAAFPGLAITLTVLGANTTGDWVRDHLDPQRGQSSQF